MTLKSIARVAVVQGGIGRLADVAEKKKHFLCKGVVVSARLWFWWPSLLLVPPSSRFWELDSELHEFKVSTLPFGHTPALCDTSCYQVYTYNPLLLSLPVLLILLGLFICDPSSF